MNTKDLLLLIGNLIALLSGAGGVILAILTARKTEAERDKVRADASSVIQQASLALVKPLKDEVENLTNRMCCTEKELKETEQQLNNEKKLREKLQTALCVLIKQLKENNLKPHWEEIDCLKLEIGG